MTERRKAYKMNEKNRNDEYSSRRRVRSREEQTSKRRVRNTSDSPVRRNSGYEEERRPRRPRSYQEEYTSGRYGERTREQSNKKLDKNSEELRAKRRQRHAEALGYDADDLNVIEVSGAGHNKGRRNRYEDELDMGRKTKKQFMWKIPDIILMIIQAVLSVMASYYLKKLLPMKFWIVLVILLVIAFVLILFGTKAPKQEKTKGRNAKQKKNKKGLVARVVSVLLSIAMLIGCMAAKKGFSALNNITGGKYQTHVMSMVVQADSLYNELADLEGKTVGVTMTLDAENMEETLEEIADKEKVSIVTQESNNVIAMGEALMNGEVDAILFNEAYRGVIEDSDESFEGKTRIIYQYEIQEELQMEEVDTDVTGEPFNVYISGIDTYGPVSAVSRSDVNMIVTVNPKTKQILMTSIPRDYYVPLATSGVKDKLTHAGIYGVEESMGTLENLFGVEIDYYARVNFTSLIKMVDALGGITVYNDQEFTSYHNHDHYPVGQIEMDGDTALEFVRERYGLSGGDNDRVKNQQKVLTAMLEKAMSPAIIKNYSSLLEAVSDSFVTNMASGDIQKLIQMQLDDMASWNIEQIAVSGTGTKSTTCYSSPGSNLYVMEPNYDTVNEAAEKIEAVETGSSNEETNE